MAAAEESKNTVLKEAATEENNVPRALSESLQSEEDILVEGLEGVMVGTEKL